jgi:mono/diheme cytochrome c family protein
VKVAGHVALALALGAGCGRAWVVPAVPPTAPALVDALEAAFMRAAAAREADYREIASPGTRDRDLGALLAAPDLDSYARAGAELFLRDFRAGPVDPLRSTAAGPAADATRCAGCHHRGGVGGAGSFSDLAFLDAPDDDVLRARPRLPPMLAGAAVLDLAARGDVTRQPFGRAPGGPRALRDAVAACARTHLAARWDDARVDAVAVWLALLPDPIEETRMRDALVLRAARGRRLFEQVGCAGCHTPSLPVASPVLPLAGGRALDLRWRLARDGQPPYRVWAYSDLRGHDLGPGLADPDGAARFVTAPLWGLASRGPYLHDGRAATVPEAIEAHDGEAAAARKRFQALTDPDQADVRIFLGSLTRPVAVEAIP